MKGHKWRGLREILQRRVKPAEEILQTMINAIKYTNTSKCFVSRLKASDWKKEKKNVIYIIVVQVLMDGSMAQFPVHIY